MNIPCHDCRESEYCEKLCHKWQYLIDEGYIDIDMLEEKYREYEYESN